MSSQSDKEAVLTVNQDFYDAFSQRDFRKMNLLWWQGTTSLCVHPGSEVLIGWETIQASWKSIFNSTNSFEIDIEVMKVELDQAIAHVVVRETVLQSSRGQKFKAQSIATNIYQKMAQKWYLVHHHGSPVMR